MDGRPLLEHAVRPVREACSEVIVVVAPDAEIQLPSDITPVRIVRDPDPYGGPLVGLVAGLEAAAESLVLVAGGDMPTLAPALLRDLLRRLNETDADAVALEHEGEAEPLPIALRLGSTLPVATDLVRRGLRSLVILLRALRLERVPEAEWRVLDSEADSLRDIDLPHDLKSFAAPRDRGAKPPTTT